MAIAPITFSYPGLLPTATNPSGPGGLYVSYPAQITMITMGLGTADPLNPVTVGYYINGLQFEQLSIPLSNGWSANTMYLYGTVIGFSYQPEGPTYTCIQTGESGTDQPSFSSDNGGIVVDNNAVWQTNVWPSSTGPITIAQRNFIPNTWTLPGYGSDQVQVAIISYDGSTAADLTCQIRFADGTTGIST